MTKSRSEEIYDHAIKNVTLFSTTLNHPWAIVPDGPARYQGWPIRSRRFRQWIAHTFFDTHLLYPGRHSLDSAIEVLGARARFGGFPTGEIFTRLGHTGNPHRPDSVLLHLANEKNELLEITPSGHRVINASQLPDSQTPRLPDSHFLSTP